MVTARQLLSVLRMAQALARVFQRDHIVKVRQHHDHADLPQPSSSAPGAVADVWADGVLARLCRRT